MGHLSKARGAALFFAKVLNNEHGFKFTLAATRSLISKIGTYFEAKNEGRPHSRKEWATPLIGNFILSYGLNAGTSHIEQAFGLGPAKTGLEKVINAEGKEILDQVGRFDNILSKLYLDAVLRGEQQLSRDLLSSSIRNNHFGVLGTGLTNDSAVGVLLSFFDELAAEVFENSVLD